MKEALQDFYGDVGGFFGQRTGVVTISGDRAVSNGCRVDEGDLCRGADWLLPPCEGGGSCHGSDEEFWEFLRESARSNPTSGFLMGQAVAFAVRSGRLLEAFEIAEDCAADEWLCMGLRGHVFSAAGRMDQAEPLFRAMADRAPSSIACALTDPVRLMGPVREADAAQRGGPCRSAAAFADTLWWLADPLHALAGNDRWTIHVDRALSLRLHREVFEPTSDFYGGESFASAAADEVRHLRRGPWDSWEHRIPSRGSGGTSSFRIWTSEAGAAQHFVPDLAGEDLSYPTWNLDAGLEFEGFTAPYGPIRAIPTQVARFVRATDGAPSSIRLALAGSIRGGPLEGVADSAYLMVSDGPGSFPLQLQAPFREGRVVFLGEAPSSRYVVSLEVVDPAGVGRHRESVAPLPQADRILSDLLLYRPVGVEEPDSLLAAVASMLGAHLVRRDEGLGLYWEIYGAPAGEPLEIELEVERQEGGFLGSVRRLLPGGTGGETGAMSWTVESKGPTSPGATVLDLRNLEGGRYTLVMRVQTTSGRVLERRTLLEVVD